MKSVPDSVFLKDMSIPGTHDTVTYTISWSDDVQTQSMDLYTQYVAGIRVVDIRCRHINDGCAIHHGAIYLHKNLEDVLHDTVLFLRDHSSETILMQMNNGDEYTPDGNSSPWPQCFYKTYMTNPIYNNSFWFPPNRNIEPTSPTLGEVRGKIVVLQSFPNAPPNGVGWLGLNTASFKTQNDWIVQTTGDLYGKWEKVRDQIDSAAGSNRSISPSFYMNYLSGADVCFPYFVASGKSSAGTDAGQLTTGWLSMAGDGNYPDFPRINCLGELCSIVYLGTNQMANYYISMWKKPFVGIIMADFPDVSLINTVLKLNIH